MKNRILYHRTLISLIIGLIAVFEVVYFWNEQERYIAGIITTCALVMFTHVIHRIFLGNKIYQKRKRFHASGTQSPDNDDKQG